MFHLAVNQSFVFGNFVYSLKIIKFYIAYLVVPCRKDEIIQSRLKSFHALVHKRVFGLERQLESLHVKV